MDLPHSPSSPQKLFQEVEKEVHQLWAFIQNRKIPGIKPELRWKKQPYGAKCNVIWTPKLYCHCLDFTCPDGKYIVKETALIVKNDFTLEAFRHFIKSEKQWIQNFVQD